MPNWIELVFVQISNVGCRIGSMVVLFCLFPFLGSFPGLLGLDTYYTVVCTRLIDVRNVLIVLHFSVHHPIKKITLDLRTRLKMDKLVKLLHLISLDKQSKVVL